MRNTKLDVMLAVLLILIGLMGLYVSIWLGQHWYRLVYAIGCLLLGSTYFSEPMRRWRRTLLWLLFSACFFNMGIRSDNDLLRFGYKAVSIAMIFIGLLSAVLTVMKREGVLPEM